MANDFTVRAWFLKTSRDESSIMNHFVPISTNKEEIQKYGIDLENMFVFWDRGGGRYSLWSAIGRSIACSIKELEV